jgi:hypothetical protein
MSPDDDLDPRRRARRQGFTRKIPDHVAFARRSGEARSPSDTRALRTHLVEGKPPVHLDSPLRAHPHRKSYVGTMMPTRTDE